MAFSSKLLYNEIPSEFRGGVFFVRKLFFFFFFLYTCGICASEVVYTIPPSDFASTMTVSGCFCRQGDKFLVLFRHPDRSCGNTWCLPAKKIETKGSPIAAAVQELKAELGLSCSQEELSLFKKFYVRLPNKDFELYLFEVNWPKGQEIILNKQEHTGFAWVSLQEALTLPLIPGAEVYIRLLFEKKGST